MSTLVAVIGIGTAVVVVGISTLKPLVVVWGALAACGATLLALISLTTRPERRSGREGRGIARRAMRPA